MNYTQIDREAKFCSGLSTYSIALASSNKTFEKEYIVSAPPRVQSRLIPYSGIFKTNCNNLGPNQLCPIGSFPVSFSSKPAILLTVQNGTKFGNLVVSIDETNSSNTQISLLAFNSSDKKISGEIQIGWMGFLTLS